MKYGIFDEQNREYVITDPKTPVKWINYLGSLAFGGFVDQTGGALICRNDPALNRITKYLNQTPAADFRGETLYLRIHTPDGYRVFSPFFTPTLDSYTRYECRVGLGYTRIISEFYGLRTEVTIFVPGGDACELREIRITNMSEKPQIVDAIPVVEYTHFDSLKQLTNADWVPQTMQSKLVEQQGGMKVLVQYAFMMRDLRINYFTSDLPCSSFDTDRKVFLGLNEYSGWSRPSSLYQPELNNSQALRGDNIAALLHPLDVLQPGETRRLVTQLGQAASLEEAQPVIDRYRQPEAVSNALTEMKHFWDAYLSRLQIHTPDESMNHMLNVYNPRQCFITFNWSRYLSLYQTGYGARGIGFRDSSQDVLGVLASMPAAAKGMIRMLLGVQKRDGSAMHQFNPLTLIASEGDALEMEDRYHFYSDDHLWAILAVTGYIKETGDWEFLEESIPYYEKDRQGVALEHSPVYEHLQRALRFTHDHVGMHGLPLLGFADWNDTVNLPKGAESLFTANLFGKALLEMIALSKRRNDPESAENFRAWYEEMRQRVNAHAWDGEWYVRYFDENGAPLGSSQNTYGQIYANGQSWPVISGYAPPERAVQALESLNKHLNTRFGIKLSTPGFNGYDSQKGGITTYPPGAKENGGIFLHANPWVMIAETIVGNGDRAFQYYLQINPAAKNEIIETFESEPYVYPQNILGDEHPQFGLARNSWLSGTASWAYQAGTQYILGVRAEFDGLRIDPCIPRAWDGFTIRRQFRGAFYDIRVHNPEHVCQGIRSVWVDGIPLTENFTQGCLLPIFGDDRPHEVEIVLGGLP
jgi:cellobiose phosphorylase